MSLNDEAYRIEGVGGWGIDALRIEEGFGFEGCCGVEGSGGLGACLYCQLFE